MTAAQAGEAVVSEERGEEDGAVTGAERDGGKADRAEPPAASDETEAGGGNGEGRTGDDGALETARAELTAREAELASASRKLTELRAEVKALRAFAAGQVAAARVELPETLLAFDPGEEAGLEARLAWLATAREQAGHMAREAAPGAAEDPRPAGTATREIPSPVPLRNMF